VKGEKEGKKVDTFQVSTLHLPTFHLREAEAPTFHLPEAEAEGEDVLEEEEEEKIRIRITSALCRKVRQIFALACRKLGQCAVHFAIQGSADGVRGANFNTFAGTRWRMKEKDVKGEKEGKKVDTFQVSTLHLPTFHLPEAEAPTFHLPEAEAEGEDVLEEGEEEKIRIRITSALCRKVGQSRGVAEQVNPITGGRSLRLRQMEYPCSKLCNSLLTQQLFRRYVSARASRAREPLMLTGIFPSCFSCM
jgi:hypothetical protein